MNYSYNDVIPQNLQNELLAIRDNLSQNFWDIGDIALMVCNYVDDNEMMVSRDFVWGAVGAFVGLSARTIREYARVARFYDYEIRKKYDVLTFSHFAMAARYPDKCYEILDYAINETDSMNRPATVDKLESVFTYGSVEYIPREIDTIETQLRGDVMAFVRNIRAEVGRISIAEEYRSEITDHLNAIERLLQFALVNV